MKLLRLICLSVGFTVFCVGMKTRWVLLEKGERVRRGEKLHKIISAAAKRESK